MYCNTCGCKVEESNRFCPACGSRLEPAPPQTKIYSSEPPTREYAPVDSGSAAVGNDPEEAVDHTVVLDGYDDPSYYQNDFAEQLNAGSYDLQDQRTPYPPVVKAYQDSFEHQDVSYTEDPLRDDPYDNGQRYHKTTAGRRIASIFMCLMLMLFGFFAMLIGTARIELTETNVRKAYQKGTLADLSVTTEKGEQTLTEVLMDNVVDAKTNIPIPLEKTAVDSFLRSQSINNFAENLVVDFAQFFVFGRTPTLLNGTQITQFLSSISEDIKSKIGYAMSEDDIKYIGQRIDGGDLSFLSIDENGGYFQKKYNVSPYTISSFFSLWALAACAGMALLCVIMIFVINNRNLPAGMSFSGSTMVIFGVINTLLAAGMLALSYIRNIFLLSELLRGFAFVSGAISLCVLAVGIVFLVIKTVLRNRI